MLLTIKTRIEKMLSQKIPIPYTSTILFVNLSEKIIFTAEQFNNLLRKYYYQKFQVINFI